MELLYFLCREKTKSFINSESTGTIFLRFFLALTSCIYGLIGVMLFNLTAPAATRSLIAGIHLFIVLLILFRNMIPNYRLRQKIIPSFFPVSSLKRFSLELVYVTYSPLTIYLAIFVFSLSFSPHYNFDHILLITTIIFNSFLLELAVKKVIDENISHKKKYFVAILLICVIFVATITSLTHYLQLLVLLITSSLLITLNWALEYASSIINSSTSKSSKNIGSANLLFRLLFSRRTIKSSLITAILFKTFFIIASVVVFKKTGELLFNSDFIFYLFLFPVIYFTYIFNNYFGYVKEFWLTFNLSAKRFFLVKSFFLPIAIILLFDFGSTVLILFNLELLDLFFLAKYILTGIILSLNALISSLLLVKKVDSEFSFSSLRNNTSILASIISVSFLSVFFLKSNEHQALIFLTIILIQGSILILCFGKYYSLVNYNFYKRVF